MFFDMLSEEHCNFYLKINLASLRKFPGDRFGGGSFPPALRKGSGLGIACKIRSFLRELFGVCLKSLLQHGSYFSVIDY